MAETTDDLKLSEAEEAPQTSRTLPVTIIRQYIRDLSFENPSAPESLTLNEQPQMEIDVDMQGRKIEDKDNPSLYEIVLLIRVTTMTKNMPVFVIELEYATLVALGEEVPEDQVHPLLFIEIPRAAFPFACQIIANTTMNGGFPPIHLKPVDFYSLYMDRHKDLVRKPLDELEIGEDETAEESAKA